MRLLISDDHAGMQAARQARFPGVPRQRCQFHLQQNAGHYVPRLEMRREVAGDLRAIFESTNRLEAERRSIPFLKVVSHPPQLTITVAFELW